jgi:hypothetical protein
VETGDLSVTVIILFEAASEAINHEAGVIHLLTLPNEVDVGSDLFDLPVQGKQRAHFSVSEDGS